jgi:type VI secretion system protein ImpE
MVALIPTRYPDTPASGDHAAMLARATTWSDAGDNSFVGNGQRLLTIGDEDVALMDLRELVMDTADG